MSLGYWRVEDTPETVRFISADVEVARIFAARLRSPRVLSTAEVNERSRAFSTLLYQNKPLSRVHREYLDSLWQDMMYHACALQNAATRP